MFFQNSLNLTEIQLLIPVNIDLFLEEPGHRLLNHFATYFFIFEVVGPQLGDLNTN